MVYINGIRIGRTTGLGTWAGAIDSTRANIGARVNNGAEPFNGQVDDVRIYNYVLTQQQVNTVMNDSSAVRFAPLTGSPQ
jgi:hypothetical protein